MNSAFKELQQSIVDDLVERNSGLLKIFSKELLKEFISFNTSYTGIRILGEKDIIIYLNAKRGIRSKYNYNDKVGELDVVYVTGKDGKEYKNAMCTNVEGGKVTICMNPYTPFISFDKYGSYVSNSCSGGYFANAEADEFKYIGSTERLVSVWGANGACANGALNVPVTVNHFAITNSKFY